MIDEQAEDHFHAQAQHACRHEDPEKIEEVERDVTATVRIALVDLLARLLAILEGILERWRTIEIRVVVNLICDRTDELEHVGDFEPDDAIEGDAREQPGQKQDDEHTQEHARLEYPALPVEVDEDDEPYEVECGEEAVDDGDDAITVDRAGEELRQVSPTQDALQNDL